MRKSGENNLLQFITSEMNFSKTKVVLFLLIAATCYACNTGNERDKTKQPKTAEQNVQIPEFNSDSAYLYVKTQVDFGPRVPNTPQHAQCAEYLYRELKKFADTTIMQSFKTRAFDGTTLNGENIIGSFNPDSKNRIFYCSHWDSRPFADHDPDPSKHKTPIDGANDGASGVGVLLEIARQIHASKPTIGLDIIFFDDEDYGPPQDSNIEGEEYWGLGAQYWAKNPHNPYYTARFGVLLDMVGAKDAKFYMEAYSMYYAPGICKKIWDTARQLGYYNYFIYEKTGGITDDHTFINEILKIPTIDIIHLDTSSSNGTFFQYWHTTGDNMSVIDKNTLKVVGQTLLTVVYQEK